MLEIRSHAQLSSGKSCMFYSTRIW